MKVLSRIDPDTYYVVTSIHVRMVRNGDKLTIPYCHIPEKAKLFKPEIQAELLGFWEEKYPERPCKVCGTLFRSNKPQDVYCSSECKKVSRDNYRKTYNEKPVERQCVWCSNIFSVSNRSANKYCCQKCRTAAITIKQQAAREKRAEKKTEKKKSHLEEKMKLAASMGIDYGELQRRETLKQVGKVVI